jgi:GR25 family glycosyltransferase involved in LPS biosynthesis
MKKYGINYSLVIVDRVTVDLHKYFCSKSGITRGEFGCTMSHLWCILNGIQNKLENILVFEDDIILHKDFTKYFCHIYDNNRDSDFLLLGAHDFMFSKNNYKNVHNNIYKPDPNSQHLYGAHANYYSLKGMKRMFNIRVSQVSFFDKEYMLMFNHFNNSGVVYPNLVVSNVTQSGLNHARYFFTDTESDYFSKCFINFNFSNYQFLYINLFDNIDGLVGSDTYEILTEKYIYNAFHDFDKMDLIKKRLSMDFFTIEDVKNIITNH